MLPTWLETQVPRALDFTNTAAAFCGRSGDGEPLYDPSTLIFINNKKKFKKGNRSKKKDKTQP